MLATFGHSPVILITGASSGIGRALAVRLAGSGARLAIVARRGALLTQLAAEVEAAGGVALPLPCDVTVPSQFREAVAATIARFGELHVLVNNAGRGNNAYIHDTPEDQLESIFRGECFSRCGMAPRRRCADMVPLRRGQIINVASVAGKIGFPGNGAYVAAKHATVGFTRALRSELAGTGVLATAVIAAGTLTDWATAAEGGSMIALFDYERERGNQLAAQMGRELPPAIPLLSADHVAQAIAGAIGDPTPELYTHPGLRDWVMEYEANQELAEQKLEPFWLANREGYEKQHDAPPAD
ncbi:MAG: oxidoreductase [Chlorobi bacterium OLB7]|nr:MAG: oxidoreductase [Chlorobi bacterium OLB7]